MYLKDKKHHIQVRISDTDYDYLCKIAYSLGGNVSDAIRYVLFKNKIGELSYDTKANINN